MRSSKPVLLVLRKITSFRAERVLIARNGSTEGERAEIHALTLLQSHRPQPSTTQTGSERTD